MHPIDPSLGDNQLVRILAFDTAERKQAEQHIRREAARVDALAWLNE